MGSYASFFPLRPLPGGRRLAAARTGVSDCAGIAPNFTQMGYLSDTEHTKQCDDHLGSGMPGMLIVRHTGEGQSGCRAVLKGRTGRVLFSRVSGQLVQTPLY